MAHYAILDENNIVTNVIVGKDEGEYDWEQHYSRFTGKTVKRTSYNTSGGVHATGGTPYRKNYASIGYSYSPIRDAFVPPRPFPSWVLDEGTCLWNAPIPMPDNGNLYGWDEITLAWMAI